MILHHNLASLNNNQICNFLSILISNTNNQSNIPRLLHFRGVKTDSLLNQSLFFNCNENFSIDVMHLFPEGVMPYIIGCVLYELVNVRGLLSIDELNMRIASTFRSLPTEKKNTPASINSLTEPGKGLSPRLAANECHCLFRYLPLIIGNLVPRGDPYWELILELSRISGIDFADQVSERMIKEYSPLADAGRFPRKR